MKYLFVLCFILATKVALSQTSPRSIASYVSKGDRFIINSISLNSDSTCFIYSSCECGDETFTKAKWNIKNDYLNLYCFPDSTYSVYPSIDYEYSDKASDSIVVYFTDYFNQGLEAMLLAFVRGDTAFNPVRIRLDQQGRVVLSKQAYYGFMMEYDQYRYDLKKGEVIGYYFEKEDKLAVIKFRSEFGQAAYDRELKQKYLGTLQYLVKEDGLYNQDGELIYIKSTK